MRRQPCHHVMLTQKEVSLGPQCDKVDDKKCFFAVKTKHILVQCESKKSAPPRGFLTIFPKWLGILSLNFTHLLYGYCTIVCFVRLQISITSNFDEVVPY